MQSPATGSRVTFLVLRYMRTPILVLVSVYAASMIGWVMIPAVDAAGNPQHMSFFHAFYFLTYTATTTGFGEIPYTFSEAQRMWGIVSLYASVIAWLYAIGSIIRLVQNPNVQLARSERRFVKDVRNISEPFVILCGFGSTGSLLARGLSDAGVAAVVIDSDIERIRALQLRDYRVAMPGLCADARVPQHLLDAGLLLSNCTAVVALTSDEHVNLKIAVTARLMNPGLRIINQSTSAEYEEILATLGGDIHVIDPFQTYARYLAATILDPEIHTLSQWTSGTPGATLDTKFEPPAGHWILCGFGRMGGRIHEALSGIGIATAVIEPHFDERAEPMDGVIVGKATQANLQAAGVKEAAGIVAGTHTDSDNLSILVNARALSPKVFVIVRQNLHMNEVVFQAAKADFIMQPSLVSARRILFILIAPLLKSFFEQLRDRAENRDDSFVADMIAQLREAVGGTNPRIWTVDTAVQPATALSRLAAQGAAASLGDLLRDPFDRDRRLDCVPLVVQDEGGETVMPGDYHPVRPGSQILLCGSSRAQWMLDATLNNEYTLNYLITGIDEPRGLAMRWLSRRLNGAAAAPDASDLAQGA
jgi:Trk K+ transport system NAD-binding subunit